MTLHGISEDAGVKIGSNFQNNRLQMLQCVCLEWRVLVAVHQDWLTADLIPFFIIIFRPNSMLIRSICSGLSAESVCCHWCTDDVS